jgi:hypothetical protein
MVTLDRNINIPMRLITNELCFLHLVPQIEKLILSRATYGASSISESVKHIMLSSDCCGAVDGCAVVLWCCGTVPG